MFNVHNVLSWFRHGTSDSRLNVLCRLLDCCIPFELHFLSTYLQELLLRTMLFNKQSETTAPFQYSDLNELREITKSSSRRQLCILLTNLKSMDQLQANNIYNILIQYDFNQFFSRVLSLEEEIVDEILLLFALASNHPAMTFSQRSFLHQRLTELRDTIEKSFECCLTDGYDNPEDVCCSWFGDKSDKSIKHEDNLSKQESEILETNSLNVSSTITTQDINETTNLVHIKDLRVIKAQQRLSDKKYEYIFEVTWTNGKVVRIHRSYGELFDFQCKLRRRHSKESGKMTRRRVIPYLPSRKPLKFCKGNDILPDITDYVREFAQLPDRVLHSEWVENFFSDGNERVLDEPSQQKTKIIETSNQNQNLNCKHNEPSVNSEVKSDKGNVSLKKCSPKGKCLTTFNKKSTTTPSARFDSKKRTLLSPKNTCTESPKDMNGKDGNKIKTSTSSDVSTKTPNIPDQPAERKIRPVRKDHKQTIDEHKKLTSTANKKPSPMTTKKTPVTMETSKSPIITTSESTIPVTISTPSIPSSTGKLSVSMSTGALPVSKATSEPSVSMTTNTASVTMPTKTSSLSIMTNGLPVSTTTTNIPVCVTSDKTSASVAKNRTIPPLTNSTSVSMTTSQSTISATTSHSACPEELYPTNVDAISVVTSPLTVNVPTHSPLCTSCLTCNKFSSNESLVSLGSPIYSPVTSFIPRSSSPAERQQFDFTMVTGMMTCSQETNIPVKLKTCQLGKCEHLFEYFTNNELLNLCDSDIDKMTLTNKEKVKLKTSIYHLKSSQRTPINGFERNNVHLASNGLLIVPNGHINQHSISQDNMMQRDTINRPMTIVDKNCNILSQNGGQHDSSLDPGEAHKRKQNAYYHEKLNGFCKPYCYNCGDCGHSGHQCVENDSLMT